MACVAVDNDDDCEDGNDNSTDDEDVNTDGRRPTLPHSEVCTPVVADFRLLSTTIEALLWVAASGGASASVRHASTARLKSSCSAASSRSPSKNAPLLRPGTCSQREPGSICVTI
jgi:hypothetical protein